MHAPVTIWHYELKQTNPNPLFLPLYIPFILSLSSHPNTSLFLSLHSIQPFTFSLFFILNYFSMEESKKRVRDESSYSPESQTQLVDSPESESQRVDSPESKIRRVDSSESQLDSVLDSEVRLQDDIFNILDDADNVPERDSVQGLDSVIKSFEDEINAPGSDSGSGDPTQEPDSGELQSNLGYLLEASDDELGLPPTVVDGEETGRVGPEMTELARLMGFEDDIPSYDAFGFGSGFTAENDGGAGGFVTVDGLFDYSDPAADVLWRSESLQAM